LAYQAEIWPEHIFGLVDYNWYLKNARLCRVFADLVTNDDSHSKNKPSHLTSKSTLFTVIKDEWDTKEDTDKSMKNTVVYDKD